jgi:suppressor of G2 allele of SKP1
MSAFAGLTASQALALGDSLTVDEEFAEAVDAYAAGLALLAGDDNQEDSDAVATATTAGSTGESPVSGEPLVERFRLLSHRSGAFYQLARFAEAADDAQSARDMNVAGLRGGEREAAGLRLGKALYQLGRYETSKRVLEQVLQLAELNGRSGMVASHAAKDWIARCVEELEPPMLEPARPSNSLEMLAAQAGIQPASPSMAAVAPSPPPRAASVAASAPSAVSTNRIHPPKYQYYQNDKVMTVSIMEPNVRAEHLQVEYPDSTTLRVVLNKQGQDFVVISGHLYDAVDVESCKTVIKEEKILIKLKKRTPKEWYDLLDKKKKKSSEEMGTVSTDVAKATMPPLGASATSCAPAAGTGGSIPRPYASNKNWDKIEKEVAEEEDKEIPEGDAAAMKLFRQIYANASEDTRRAMIKSYQTSGGTVLSTNWDEVSKKDYEKERTAPKGQEWKNWEGDKLA